MTHRNVRRNVRICLPAFTFLGGTVLLSGIELAGGRVAALAVLAIVVVIFGAVYLLSPRPAYEVVSREPSGDGTQP